MLFTARVITKTMILPLTVCYGDYHNNLTAKIQKKGEKCKDFYKKFVPLQAKQTNNYGL